MATNTRNPGADAFAQAADTFDAVLKRGAKMQQEMIDWWSKLADEVNANDLGDRAQKFSAEAGPMAQKHLQDQLKAFDESCQNALDLLRQGFETTQADSVAELQQKTHDLWETSLRTMRTNTEALVQANTRAMNSFADLVRRNVAGKPRSGGKA